MEVFNYVPEFGATKEVKPRVTQVSFGDGYETRVASGINNKTENWTLSFTNRTQSESDAIDDFFSARGGVEAFYWTPPYSSPKYFVCRSWTRSVSKANLHSIQATFEQVYL